MVGFLGFSAKAQKTPIPNVFFTTLLPEIKDVSELRIVLHVFWLLFQKKGYPKFVTFRELLGDKHLAAGLGLDFKERLEVLDECLRLTVDQRILITTEVESSGIRHRLFFLNTESDRLAINRIDKGVLDIGAVPITENVEWSRPNVFKHFEENIGPLTPLVAEKLKQAIVEYSEEWIIDSILEAVQHGVRKWIYIEATLKSWKAEGRVFGEPRRHIEEREGTDKYFQGRYGHLVKRRLS